MVKNNRIPYFVRVQDKSVLECEKSLENKTR